MKEIIKKKVIVIIFVMIKEINDNAEIGIIRST